MAKLLKLFLVILRDILFIYTNIFDIILVFVFIDLLSFYSD